MKDHDYQQLYDEVYKELVTPTMRAKLARLVEHGSDPTIEDLRARLATVERERDEARDQLRVTEEQVEALGHMNESNVALAKERDEALSKIETMSAASMAEFYKYKERRNEQFAAYEVLAAQFAAASATVNAECVEHVELNGHVDVAKQCVDFLDAEANRGGDPSGKLRDFVTSLSIVIHQFDRQRRRASWYEAAHTAGKQKLIESAVAKEVEAIAAWLERKSAILATEANSLAPVISDVAAAIRKGAWKP